MSFHLHIGAHKTASTHLQAALVRDRARLAAASVDFASPREVRDLIGSGRRAAAKMGALPSLRRAGAARRLLRLDRGGTLVLASDENSLGQCAEIFETGAIYPTARRRLGVWRRLAGRRRTTVFLSIRDYGPFLSGAYAQAIRNAPFFRPSPEALLPLPRRWPAVVADVRAALPGARIVLWRYEDYAPAPLLRLLAGCEVEPVARRPMATPSAEGLAAMTKGLERGAVLERSRMETAMRDHPGPAFSLWTAAQAARLSEAYATDVETLRADLGQDFLNPKDEGEAWASTSAAP